VSPDGALADDPALALDSAGVLHVAWRGSEIYYSRAHVSQAGETTGWSRPETLSEGGGSQPALVAARGGTVDLVYARPDGEIAYRSSNDGGRTWAAPSTISNTMGTNSAAAAPRIAADQSGRLHVVWTEFQLPAAWPPTGTFYTRSVDGGITWTPPLRFAGVGYGQTDVLAAGTGEVHLMWHAQALIGENWHRWSRDGGQTWSLPREITPKLKTGFSGFTVGALDSAGVLNLVSVGGGRRGRAQDVYYVAWDGSAWSEPTPISQRAIGKLSVESPWITVGGGNRLHAVYEDDFQRIWYTSRLSNAPSVPLEPVPTPAPAPTSVRPATSATRVSLVAPPAAVSVASGDEPLTLHPLLVGALGPLVLVGAILARRVWRP
jgi:hypothetical protein